jgi:hypothetical protein
MESDDGMTLPQRGFNDEMTRPRQVIHVPQAQSHFVITQYPCAFPAIFAWKSAWILRKARVMLHQRPV